MLSRGSSHDNAPDKRSCTRLQVQKLHLIASFLDQLMPFRPLYLSWKLIKDSAIAFNTHERQDVLSSTVITGATPDIGLAAL